MEREEIKRALEKLARGGKPKPKPSRTNSTENAERK